MSITVLLRIFRKNLTDALAGKLEIIKVMADIAFNRINSNGYDNIISQNFEKEIDGLQSDFPHNALKNAF